MNITHPRMLKIISIEISCNGSSWPSSISVSFLKLKLNCINPSRPNLGRKEKSQIFIFTFLCGASKGFMKALKAFIKPFEAPQRSVKIKISLNFYFNTAFRNARNVKG